MNKLIKLALAKGFINYDGSIKQEDPAYNLILLAEIRQWFIEHYDIYVQEQCFNTFNWGIRIYTLTGSTEVGAPIVFEEEEANHVTNMDALISGLTQAFNYI